MSRRSLKYRVIDLTLIANSLFLAFIIIYHGDILHGFDEVHWLVFPAFVLVYQLAFLPFRIYRSIWDFANFYDVSRLIYASLSAAVLLTLSLRTSLGISLDFLVIANLLIIILLIMARILARIRLSSSTSRSKATDRIVLAGAGEAARGILADLKTKGEIDRVIGLLDDNREYQGMTIYGRRVLGAIKDTAEICREFRATLLIISVEQITAEKIQDIIDNVDLKQVKVRIIPASRESLLKDISISTTRDIKAEDLLGRKSTELDHDLIREKFRDKVVFISGAGGSIGSEICHQLLSFPIKCLVALSRSEYSLYRLQEKLGKENRQHVTIRYYLGNIKDNGRLEEIFSSEKPHIVFHAAAHKHVPYMEEYEKEAVKNNIFGTENIIEISRRHSVSQFVLVSTDKAVNPANVMGVSKRIAELLTLSANGKDGLSASLVRFGNVLGSRGSVVPLFQKQIMAGGPITVTHPEVVRFFMTIPEAALLTINCGALSKGGERFILDMGKPIKIDDLVRRMIRLNGLEADKDIEIRYTGMRPGEKIYEELLTKGENVEATRNKKIYICRDSGSREKEVSVWLKDMHRDLDKLDRAQIREKFKRLVPEYQSHSKG